MTPRAEAPWTERKLTPVQGGWLGRPLADRAVAAALVLPERVDANA